MFTRAMARSMMGLVIPEKVAATVVLNPGASNATTVSVYQAWMKPMDVKYSNYGGMNIQGDETRIMIPDYELNPTANGREVRAQDSITIAGVSYNVLSSRLMSVRTVWECICRKGIV